MKYYHELYTNEKWVSRQLGNYLIVLAKNEKNHLEFFHTGLFKQLHIPTDDLFVVGIAKDERDALELIEKITQEVYDETGDADIRNYILRKQKAYEEGNV